MSGTDDFDREVKALVNRGKLSSSAVASLSELAMANIRSDSQLVSTLYRHHRKASPANKLVSLYLIDAIAREAKSRQKKADKEGKSFGTVAGSTTPAESPPRAAAGPSAGDGDFASFLRKLEAVLSKIVLDNWENGLPEHKEKVRKVLDIWTRASTFGASALAKISSKLLAVSAAAPATAAAPPQMSPGRPSLSPGPAADTPPRDSTATAPAPTAPAGIPANVLALLQAKAPPSQAALEQKKHDDVESEVERALREAREGTSLATSDAPRVSGPTSFAPSQTPYAGNVQSSSVPFGHSQTSHGGSNPLSASSAGAPFSQPGPSSSLYEAQRLGPSSRSAGGGYGSAPALGSGGGGAYGSSMNASDQSPQGYHGQHSRDARAGSQEFASHARQQSGGQRDGGRGADTRGGSDTRTPHQSHDSYGGGGGGGGPRGQTRSFDASQTGPGENVYGAPSSTYGCPEEPPTKRPYRPDVTPQNAPSHHGGGYGQPASASSFSGESTPNQQQAFGAPPQGVPPASGYQSNDGGAPPSSTGPPLDPTTFDATSPASWTTFVNLLRTSHPYFASLGRMPTMEEVMSLCAPSAMMAFGGAATGGMGMPPMGAGQGMMGGGGAPMMPQGGGMSAGGPSP